MTTALQQALEALDVAEAHLTMLLGGGAAAYPSLTFGQTIAAAQRRLREELKAAQTGPSYHDVEVEYSGRRMRLFDADFGLQLTCTRVGGWELWDGETLVASEFGQTRLTIYVRGVCICGGKEQP